MNFGAAENYAYCPRKYILHALITRYPEGRNKCWLTSCFSYYLKTKNTVASEQKKNFEILTREK